MAALRNISILELSNSFFKLYPAGLLLNNHIISDHFPVFYLTKARCPIKSLKFLHKQFILSGLNVLYELYELLYQSYYCLFSIYKLQIFFLSVTNVFNIHD